MGENLESIYVKLMCAILRVWSCFSDGSRPGQAEVMINVLWVGLPRLHWTK